MTVDPRLQLTPGEYLIHPDGSASRVVGKRNMTVDEILATGRYTDRRGRAWDYFDTRVDYDRWQRWESRGDEDLILEPDQMRLLIERDQHRDVCVGLHWCDSHPVPRVHFNIHTGAPIVIAGDEYIFADGGFSSHAEAMDAARALAVGG